MRLATPDGFVSTDTRERAWPLAGANFPDRVGNGWAQVVLGKTPEGSLRTATYEQIYRANPYVNAAVLSIARSVARMSLKTYAFDAEGNRERVRGDLPMAPGRPVAGVALDRLVRRPEPGWSRTAWKQKLMIDRLVHGNALAHMDRSTGAISALWHLPWNRIEVQEGESVPILYYEYVGIRDPKRFLPEDVIHFGRGTDPSEPIGLSPLEPLKATIALHDALMRHVNAFFQNQARPSGVLEVQPGTRTDVLDKIKDEIIRLYSGVDNAGRMLISSGKFHPITQTAQQAELIELAKLSREEIAIAYGLSPTDLGILDRAIMSNIRENRSRFVRDAVGYWASEFEDELNAQLVEPNPSWRGMYLEHDLGEFLQPDLEARADVYDKMRHVLTPNEMRAMENKAPLKVEGADTVWMAPGQVGLGVEPPAPESSSDGDSGDESV